MRRGVRRTRDRSRVRTRVRTRVRIRTALPGLLCLLLAAGPAGCARQADEPRRTLTVLGPWTGGEERSFRELLRRFEERNEDVRVDYQGTTATRELLLSGVLAGDPPDVAVLPVLGDLADYAQRGQLHPLDDSAPDEEAYGGPWLSRPAGMPERYWLPVKADLKSIVWYEKGREPDASRADVDRWCVGMGSDATSGWPGSDWIEDILLQRSGATAYDAWATGEMEWTDGPVVEAWRIWGAFMSGGGDGDGDGGGDGDGEGKGGAARRALLTDHRGPEGGNGLLFDTDPERDCELEHQGSFARSLYGEKAPRADFEPSPRLLPGADRESRNREVAGDFAAMFKESEQAGALMRFLASLEAQRAWATGVEPPAFSAHQGVTQDVYPADDPVSRRVVREFRQADRLCLDASDVMPPTIRRVFHEKVLEFLADPGRDPVGLLEQIQRVKEGLPPGTPWLERACG